MNGARGAIALHAGPIAIGYRRGRQERRVAGEIDVSVGRGELICLVGPNGAGKSTLLRTLAGMQSPLSGSVTIALADGLHPLQSIPPTERARQIAIVLTERIDVPAFSARDVVALGRTPYLDWTGRLRDSDRIAVRRALHAVEAEDIAAAPYYELSDGQRQRILIARALAQEPAILILDEPTAFLDLPRRVEIMRLLRDLAHEGGCAVVMSTHDLELALRTADQLWVMEPGRLSAGSPRDLAADGTVGRALLGRDGPVETEGGLYRAIL